MIFGKLKLCRPRGQIDQYFLIWLFKTNLIGSIVPVFENATSLHPTYCRGRDINSKKPFLNLEFMYIYKYIEQFALLENLTDDVIA